MLCCIGYLCCWSCCFPFPLCCWSCCFLFLRTSEVLQRLCACSSLSLNEIHAVNVFLKIKKTKVWSKKTEIWSQPKDPNSISRTSEFTKLIKKEFPRPDLMIYFFYFSENRSDLNPPTKNSRLIIFFKKTKASLGEERSVSVLMIGRRSPYVHAFLADYWPFAALIRHNHKSWFEFRYEYLSMLCIGVWYGAASSFGSQRLWGK